jgi:hypothetical protein
MIPRPTTIGAQVRPEAFAAATTTAAPQTIHKWSQFEIGVVALPSAATRDGGSSPLGCGVYRSERRAGSAGTGAPTARVPNSRPNRNPIAGSPVNRREPNVLRLEWFVEFIGIRPRRTISY